MKKYLFLFAFLLIGTMSFSQLDERTWIRGKVLYLSNNVIAANVVNNTSQEATITDENGEFEIKVKMGDRLVFSSLQYQIRSIIIDKDILQKSRIVIDVNEKVNQLREVVVGPENTEKFIDLKEEEFKKVDYTFDKSTKIENQILRSGRFNNGLNFINLYKVIAKSGSKEEISKDINQMSYKPSDLIREVYDDLFFEKNLGIPNDKIMDFLLYCDEKFPSKVLFKKSNEFQLIDFLIKQSDKYKKIIKRG
tara:strand:+ start:276 stop:1025 length:750 start_codon:yes stop_codon:yes gene_type:complete